MTSLKTNIILNFLNTVTGLVFPMITFPYATRVLMPEGIGSINFLSSIVAYVVLLTNLGIPMYAVREVAKYRDNKVIRNQITVEILILNLFLCLLGYFLIFGLAHFINRINEQKDLFYVLSITILFTALGINWFYQAIEDFKFITIRALVFRLLSVLALFIFVKTKDDLLIYALVLVGSTVGNNFINFLHLKTYISLHSISWNQLRFFHHLAPSFRIFILNIITSIYLNLNTVMLGSISGDESVGYYTAGTKLSYVILGVISSLGVVMLPRCANLIETNRFQHFVEITEKSYRFVVALSFPCVVGLILLSSPVINIFCGNEFGKAISVLCWTAPIVIFIGLSNVIGIQIFYPLGKEIFVIWSTLGGDILNFILNLLLIPLYKEDGAAFSTFIAEGSVLAFQFIYGRKYIPFPIFSSEYKQYILASIFVAVILIVLSYIISNVWTLVILSVFLGGAIYFSILYAMQDSILLEILVYITKLMKK